MPVICGIIKSEKMTSWAKEVSNGGAENSDSTEARQNDSESRPSAQLAAQGQISAHAGDDVVANGKPQAPPNTNWLGREKPIENALANFFRNSRASIFHLNDQVSQWVRVGDGSNLIGVGVAGRDRLRCIDQAVDKNLSETRVVSVDQGRWSEILYEPWRSGRSH